MDEQVRVNTGDLVGIVGELYIEIHSLRKANAQLSNTLKAKEEKAEKEVEKNDMVKKV